jgi:NADH-quinone oxidoreductase subunit I
MKELIGRLFQVDVLKGMGVTFRTQHPANVYTEQYPLERLMVAERYRGAPQLNNHPKSGETLCISCNLFALACPTDALELTQDFEMAYYSREGAIWDRHRLEEGPTPTRYTR